MAFSDSHSGKLVAEWHPTLLPVSSRHGGSNDCAHHEGRGDRVGSLCRNRHGLGRRQLSKSPCLGYRCESWICADVSREGLQCTNNNGKERSGGPARQLSQWPTPVDCPPPYAEVPEDIVQRIAAARQVGQSGP